MAEKKNSCCTNALTSIVMSCSGGSNVGQISNQVAWRFGLEGLAKFFCLAGIGGHVSGMIASVRGADNILVLDGCPVGCARKCMEEARIDDFKYLIVTDLGIEKKSLGDVEEQDIINTLQACRKLLSGDAVSVAQQVEGCCG